MYSHGIHNCLTEKFNVDVLILKEHRIFHNLLLHRTASMIRGLFSRVPLNVIFHSAGIRKLNLTQGDYRYIVVDHIEALGAIEGVDTPYILIAQNLEYRLSNDKLQSRLVRSFFQLTNRLRSYEHSGFANAKGVICISATEATEISKFTDYVVQLLPSFPTKELATAKSDKIRFGFIGPASWQPNARTVQKLASAIFPGVDRDIEFVLAGAGWESVNFKLPKNTRLLGFVEDTKEFWENVDFLLAPTEQGAGVNVKICEALHYGVAVITNTKSAKAIFGENSIPDSVIIADTDKELQACLNHIEPTEGTGSKGGYTQKLMGEKLTGFWELLEN